MRILVFGSLNIDHVYHVEHFMQAGETMSSLQYTKNAGGKGLNQAIALANAGQDVCFAGAIGEDGLFLKEQLTANGVDVSLVRIVDTPTGHAVIQINQEAENSILLYGGANQSIDQEAIWQTLSAMTPGDLVLLQNEISHGDEVIRRAKDLGLQIALNPSPCTPELIAWPLDKVDWLILNEIEGEQLSGQSVPDKMLDVLLERYPQMHIVLTLGAAGAIYADIGKRIHGNAVPVKAVDTTAAGDTFTGYFLHWACPAIFLKLRLRLSHCCKKHSASARST